MFKKILIVLISILFLKSCGTIKEGFTNPKKDNSDEFLVEKKSPLIMPPDYDELPEPNNNKSLQENKGEEFKGLLSENGTEDIKDNETQSKNLEESLLKKIK